MFDMILAQRGSKYLESPSELLKWLVITQKKDFGHDQPLFHGSWI